MRNRKKHEKITILSNAIVTKTRTANLTLLDITYPRSDLCLVAFVANNINPQRGHTSSDSFTDRP